VKIRWTRAALTDLDRLHDFLALVAPEAAVRVVADLIEAPERLLAYPRLGSKVEGHAPAEVRQLVMDKYVIYYEILAEMIYVIRVWHSREERT
jgi:plasmid stabilization system protein ParE